MKIKNRATNRFIIFMRHRLIIITEGNPTADDCWLGAVKGSSRGRTPNLLLLYSYLRANWCSIPFLKVQLIVMWK
jgi:hypothetical protein